MAGRFSSGTPLHAAYNVLLGCALVLASPVLIPYLLAAGKRRKNLAERLGMKAGGIPPRGEACRVWIHAVSVGETMSVASLVRRLRRRGRPLEVLLSTVTITGQDAASKVLGSQIDGRFYFPIDLPWICARFLDRVRPDIVAIIETEIWPNFLAACAARNVPVVILNGRISDRSYRRYRRFRFFFARVLGALSAVSTQTEEDARRFRDIGAAPGIVSATGNMKFDIALPPAGDLSPLREWLLAQKRGGTSWLIAGSTHEGEEAAVLAAFATARERRGSARLLLAPRHPERFAAVEALCAREGFETIRRSALDGAEEHGSAPVVLLDTVGELATAYSAADIAFVGGSLVPKGGHNILEPALFGVPVVTGPHMQNFAEIAALFFDAGALTRVAGPAELSDALARWAADPSGFDAMGRKGRELLDAFGGAAERNADIVLDGIARRAGTGR